MQVCLVFANVVHQLLRQGHRLVLMNHAGFELCVIDRVQDSLVSRARIKAQAAERSSPLREAAARTMFFLIPPIP